MRGVCAPSLGDIGRPSGGWVCSPYVAFARLCSEGLTRHGLYPADLLVGVGGLAIRTDQISPPGACSQRAKAPIWTLRGTEKKTWFSCPPAGFGHIVIFLKTLFGLILLSYPTYSEPLLALVRQGFRQPPAADAAGARFRAPPGWGFSTSAHRQGRLARSAPLPGSGGPVASPSPGEAGRPCLAIYVSEPKYSAPRCTCTRFRPRNLIVSACNGARTVVRGPRCG